MLSGVVMRFYWFIVSNFLFIFFFQAEDGIRDRNVTGVQTCALPILRITIRRALRSGSSFATANCLSPTACPKGPVSFELGPTSFARRSRTSILSARSEERRVGKECRARWGAGEVIKKGAGS